MLANNARASKRMRASGTSNKYCTLLAVNDTLVFVTVIVTGAVPGPRLPVLNELLNQINLPAGIASLLKS